MASVLVVGGGPVGLSAAALLGRYGLDVVLVERRREVNPHPRARSINVRTAEIFRQWGILDELLDVCLPEPWTEQMIYCETLAGEEVGRVRADIQPTVDGVELSPAAWLLSSQDQIEPVIARYAARFDGVALRWGTSLESIETDGDSARATVVRPDGRSETIETDWAVAADGATSGVRRQLGIEMIGGHDLATLVNCHFTADLKPLTDHRPAMLYWTSGPARNVFQKIDVHDRWLCQLGYNPKVNQPADFDHATALDWIRRSVGADVDIDLHDVIPWTMSATVAERFRHGRLFLAGDAAHQLPPSGGFGMNTGVQDVHNLAWKLAFVARGWAGDGLLETYQSERRPVATYNVERSLENSMAVGRIRRRIEAGGGDAEEAIAASRRYGNWLGMDLGLSYQDGCVVPDGTSPPSVDDEVSQYAPTARPGHRAPHLRLPDGSSTLDWFDDRFVLLAADRSELDRAWPGHRAVRMQAIGHDVADAYGVSDGGAVLVRPDGHVAWRSTALDSARNLGTTGMNDLLDLA